MKGQIALSLAGRDKGRVFMIVDTIDENYLLIADGLLRKIDKPKRKKQKHLKLLDCNLNKIPETNRELAKVLSEFSQS